MLPDIPLIGLGRRTRMLQRGSEILVRVVSWIYVRSGMDPEQFVNDVVIEDKRNVDDSQRYDFSNMPPALLGTGGGGDVGTDLKWLSQYVKNLVVTGFGDRLYVQLPNNIIQKLPIFLSRIRRDTSVIKFGDHYVSSEDFIVRSNTTVIVGSANYKQWFDNTGPQRGREKKGVYDIPLVKRLELVGMPAQCVIVRDNKVSYMFPLSDTLESSLEIAKEFYNLTELKWLLIESRQDGSVEVVKNETGGTTPYAVIFPHSDKRLYSLIIRISG